MPPNQRQDQSIFTPPQESVSPSSPEQQPAAPKPETSAVSHGLEILDHDLPHTFLALQIHAEKIITAAGVLRASGAHLLKTTSPFRWIGVPVIQRRARSYVAADGAMRSAKGTSKTASSTEVDNDLKIFIQLRQVGEQLTKNLGGYEKNQDQASAGSEETDPQSSVLQTVDVWAKRQRIGEREWAWGVYGMAAGWTAKSDQDIVSQKELLGKKLREHDKNSTSDTSFISDYLKQLAHNLYSKICANMDKIGLLFIVDIINIWLKKIGEHEIEVRTAEHFPIEGPTLAEEMDSVVAPTVIEEKTIVELAVTSTKLQDPYTVMVCNHHSHQDASSDDLAEIATEIDEVRGRDPNPKPCYCNAAAPEKEQMVIGLGSFDVIDEAPELERASSL